jgi:hypothetical protein
MPFLLGLVTRIGVWFAAHFAEATAKKMVHSALRKVPGKRPEQPSIKPHQAPIQRNNESQARSSKPLQFRSLEEKVAFYQVQSKGSGEGTGQRNAQNESQTMPAGQRVTP